MAAITVNPILGLIIAVGIVIGGVLVIRMIRRWYNSIT